ncbi:hypothetical protein AcW1_004355 [Taiwanofungus camphoratus]|nr:hypothetical protein AcW2_006638 [Antrodia cinnamomea]KAI0939270.1 hypothetical protein AcV5_000734 [Antrodia cinnamomea]KAI0952193.1 hypothetical protein AcV7_008073 [Antrodia cinnamomea]KAI0959564.1 hypothetical protein AcW1_004355 [Antrodia cinnamomea]
MKLTLILSLSAKSPYHHFVGCLFFRQISRFDLRLTLLTANLRVFGGFLGLRMGFTARSGHELLGFSIMMVMSVPDAVQCIGSSSQLSRKNRDAKQSSGDAEKSNVVY